MGYRSPQPAPSNPFPAANFSKLTGTVLRLAWACLVVVFASGAFGASATSSSAVPLSPTALAASPDGRFLYLACATANQVAAFDLARGRIAAAIEVFAPPTGLVLSRGGERLYVTTAAPVSHVSIIDTASGTIVGRIATGHTAMSPVLSPDGRSLFVCNRFNDDVAVIDLRAQREVRRLPARREPVAAALTPDGRYLLVANHLHAGRADVGQVAASITVIDVESGRPVKDLLLPNGSGLLNDLRVSPDGRYAVVTHVLARFPLPTTQLERGWMNTNAGTLIDLNTLEILNTVLLDSVDSGAANPWGAAWSADGQTLVITQAGTHEVSLIDFPGLLAKLTRLPAKADPGAKVDSSVVSRERADVPNDLSFLVDLRRRLRLPADDRGPRAVARAGDRFYVANYFSDTLTVVDPAALSPKLTSLPLGPAREETLARRGEALFHDATLCFQGWQSCASCHPGDGRVDALNWDLLNDDLGNPKNNKSLLLAHRTPPAMSLGVRDTAESAVRAGIRHILFTVQPESVAVAMDEYLRSLQPVPSPYLVNGQLSPAALRGREVFGRPSVACASCHPPGLFTNLLAYDVGTRGPLDRPGDEFDTPTLVELWRTAPYLHDGSVVSLRELFASRNPDDLHGQTSALSAAELDDLIAYLLSL